MVIILLIEIVALFFLSRVLTSELSYSFLRLFGSEKISVWLLSLIFLPGTIVHELSHAIAAQMLFVHIGSIDLVPKLYGDKLKLGSVEVGKSDVFRDFFIGIAPFFSGCILLILILNYAFINNFLGLNFQSVLFIYLIFTISNTMYSSKKDLEGAVEFFVLILIPIIFLYIFRIQIDISAFVKLVPEKFIEYAALLMLAPLIIDVVAIAIAKIINRS